MSGRHNENTSNQAFVGGDPVVRLGRFGLRAAGPTILQFVTGGIQGELGFTTELTPTEPNNPANIGVAGLRRPGARSRGPRVRSAVLPPAHTPDGAAGVRERPARGAAGERSQCPAGGRGRPVQRGARLFGIDLVAFANRMIPGPHAGRRK